MKRNAPETLSDYWDELDQVREAAVLKCKQLSLKMVVTLGWPLVIKFALPPDAEAVAKAVAKVVHAWADVVVEVSDLSASR